MKKRIIISSLILLSLAGLFGLASAYAAEEPLSDEQQQKIIENCTSAKATMQRVERDDLVARTIRGRGYNTTLDLMKTLNSRLALNAVDTKQLTPIPAAFQAAYQEFYNDYTAYDGAIEQTIKFDCNQTQKFYDQLEKARNKRAEINQDIVTIQTLITDYEALVVALEQQYQLPVEEDVETRQ